VAALNKESSALQVRQALERHHQRQRDVVDFVLRRLDHRLRQPGPDIGRAPVPRRFQLVEAQPRHDAAQPRKASGARTPSRSVANQRRKRSTAARPSTQVADGQ
jgi:hypothetical protein